jgi:geranylgeranyl reductase family protein
VNFLVETWYDADVLIAGGGPAGAACAYHLATAGIKVILVDFQKFPRDKVCGDFVGPVAIKELEGMGITVKAEFQHSNIITQAAVFLDGKPLITKSIPHIEELPDHGRVIPREMLDEWIYDAARQQGVTMISPCRFTRFEVHDNCVISYCKSGSKEVTFTTKYFIGADGSSSTAARLLNGAKPDPKDRIVAVRAYFENIHCVSQQAELYFTSKSFPGYYWFFPTGKNEANIGVGMVLDNFPKEDINLKELLMDLIAGDATLKMKIGKGKIKDKVVGWPLSTYNPDVKITAERVLLAGDAAGLINSLNGEGIQYALLSGRWAAETIIECFAQNKYSHDALKKYEQTIKHFVGYDMCLSNMVIQFIRNRHLNPLWLNLLEVMTDKASKDEQYANVAGGILAGVVPASEAVSFSFIGKSVMQGIATIVDTAMNTAKQGPVHIVGQGIRAAGFALSQVSSVLNQPEAYINWTKGLVNTGADLSGYVLKDIRRKILK